LPVPDWVSAGASLQVGSETRRQLTVRVGVDFGTAFTKVAIRAAGHVFFVDWEDVQRGPSPYFLAGELSEMAAQVLELGRHAGSKRVIGRLKLPFLGLESPPKEEQLAYAASFLALVLRYSRAWLYRHHRSLLAGNRLVWEVNLGAPTASWAKGEALRNHYHQLGLAAWKLSQASAITAENALQVVTETIPAQNGAGLDSLAVLPEFAAQIAGFVHSPQRRDGLYLLMDVGAGTVDVACFRIMYHEGTNRYPVFGCRVEPLGTHYLMSAREAAVAGTYPGWLDACEVPVAEQLAVEWGCDANSLRSADERFSALVATVVHAVLTFVRFRKDRTAPEWSTHPMPVFMAGGGAPVVLYRHAISRAFDRLGVKMTLRTLSETQAAVARLPYSAGDFARLSVAYGLTMDAQTIGERIPPDRIPDDLLESPAEFITHEQIYSER
jgi:hypothetical protein